MHCFYSFIYLYTVCRYTKYVCDRSMSCFCFCEIAYLHDCVCVCHCVGAS